jgi:hypothetical protein
MGRTEKGVNNVSMIWMANFANSDSSHVRRILLSVDLKPDKKAKIHGVPESVLKELDRGFFSDKNAGDPLPDWRTWLDQPETLPELLAKGEKELRLLLDDLRVQPFVCRILPYLP